ncbi:MAG: ATPase [Gemmatimonadetes bacterium]|nr:MAG: ATPase [Gemmatimonadota bacterium]
MTAMAEHSLQAVRKSVTVSASPDEAFEIFTEDFDSWWPHTHHIGKAPMTKAIIEGRRGGRCYTEHEDGSEADWGTILAWEPPRGVLIAWQIAANWQFEPDLKKSSEVEIRFTPVENGKTRVDLEHRGFERMTAGAAEMRTGVGGEGGWGGLLQLFAARVEQKATKGES